MDLWIHSWGHVICLYFQRKITGHLQYWTKSFVCSTEWKKIQFLSSKILPHRATVSTFVCKAVCTILAFLFPKIGKSKKCRPLYQPPQGSYVQVFKYKILIRNWEQKVLLQTIAHNKMKSYSVYLRRKFRFKEQPTCSSSVFFLCL